MRGRVIYVVHNLRAEEKELIAEVRKEWGLRIFWQQFTDGFLSFRHYGVDMGDGTVVHFRGDRQCVQKTAWIQHTELTDFCCGACPCLAREVHYCFPPEIVAQRALAQVGNNFGGYHFLFNNCEHFANWCACDRRISRQVMMRKE